MGSLNWDFSPDACCILDAYGMLVAANKRFCHTVGPTSTLMGIDFVVNLIAQEDRERFVIALNRARSLQDDIRGTIEEEIKDAQASDLEEWERVPNLRACRTLVLGSKADFPIYRKYDWLLTSEGCDGRVVCSGRMGKPPGEEEQEQETELLDFLNNAPIAMHWLSGTGHVLWANQTELNVLGYTKEEYFGKPIMDFCPDETELVLEIFKTLGSGNAIKDVPVRFRTKNGQIRDLLIDSNVNWNADGSFRHTRCCIRDDTNRKLREERLRVTAEKERELAAIKAALMRKLLHEIRTPCHVVCGLLASLEDELRNPSRSDGDKIEAAMADTLGASTQMQLLNEKIVDASDAQFFRDGKVPKLQSSSFDLQAALVALFKNLEMRRPSSEQGPGLRRVFKFGGSEVAWTDLIQEPALWPHQMPRMFVGDEAKLMRVISRLLDNALKACNEGEVCLEVKAWGTSGDQPYRLTFNVVDTGPGIPTGEDVNSYFHSGCRHRNFSLMDEKLPISHLEGKELVADTEGMGLGLFIAFRLTEILGGELQYVRSSDCVRGSAETWFHFTVPLALEENSQHDFALAAGPIQAGGVSRSPSDDLVGVWMEAADSSQGLKHVDFGAVSEPIEGRAPAVGLMNELRRKPHVLIVDDMTICLKVAVKMMGSLGCTCDTASNGDEALEVLCKAPTSFDMVLMDLRMPVMDGIEATARLRQDEMLADLPVVAFTAEELETEIILGMGFDSMVRKPATKASLSAVLSELVLDVMDPGLRPPRSTRLQELRSSIANRPPSEERKKKMHALLVEDNSVCQKVATKMLSRLGFKVTTANHGVECLDLLHKHLDFDVILMDLRMPVMGGAEATRALRKMGHEKIPVIALSAETRPDEDTRELFAAVVNKPCNLPALKTVLSELRVLPSACDDQ